MQYTVVLFNATARRKEVDCAIKAAHAAIEDGDVDGALDAADRLELLLTAFRRDIEALAQLADYPSGGAEDKSIAAKALDACRAAARRAEMALAKAERMNDEDEKTEDGNGKQEND